MASPCRFKSLVGEMAYFGVASIAVGRVSGCFWSPHLGHRKLGFKVMLDVFESISTILKYSLL